MEDGRPSRPSNSPDRTVTSGSRSRHAYIIRANSAHHPPKPHLRPWAGVCRCGARRCPACLQERARAWHPKAFPTSPPPQDSAGEVGNRHQTRTQQAGRTTTRRGETRKGHPSPLRAPGFPSQVSPRTPILLTPPGPPRGTAATLRSPPPTHVTQTQPHWQADTGAQQAANAPSWLTIRVSGLGRHCDQQVRGSRVPAWRTNPCSSQRRCVRQSPACGPAVANMMSLLVAGSSSWSPSAQSATLATVAAGIAGQCQA